MGKSKALAILALAVMLPASGQGDDASRALDEWRLLRDELRRLSLPVASHVETPEQVAADIARVRRELARRGGRTPSSSLQRVGGGSPAPARAGQGRGSGLHPTPRLSTHRLR
jgi:hypothetical protein